MVAVTEKHARPLQELVPWLFPVTDQLVVCKDSGLLASFEFVGVDGDATTTDDTNGLLDKIDNGFDYLAKKHISVWWTVLRKKSGIYPDGDFANPIAKILDDEHKSMFLDGQNFTNRHFVTISLYPEVGTSRYLDRVKLLIEEGFNPLRAAAQAAFSMLSTTGSFQWSSDELVSVVKNYEELLSSFSLAVNGLGLRRLVGDEFHGFLHKTVSPGSEWSDVKLPKNGIYMDAALPDKTVDVWDGVLSFGELSHINFKDTAIAVSTFLHVIMMPLTFSITNGLAFGLIAYVFIKLLKKEFKEINFGIIFLTLVSLTVFIVQEGH